MQTPYTNGKVLGWRRLWIIIRYHDVEFREMEIATILFLWGVWFLCPFWSVFTIPPLSLMAHLGNRFAWGAVFVITAFIKLAGLLNDSFFLKRLSALVGFILFGFMACIALGTNIRYVSGVTTAALCFYSATIYFRLGVRETQRKEEESLSCLPVKEDNG